MKAIVVDTFGDESVLHYTDVTPEEPKDNEVRIRISAVGVNPVDTYIRSGNYATLPKLPYTPGNDAAGVVDAVGKDVKRLAPGQRVFVAAALAKRNTGSYAQYTVCDAAAVVPLPESISFAEGAGLGTTGLAAAYALFSRGQLRPGETVLVHGASGGVGSLAVQLARKAGARVFGTAGSQEGLQMLESIGAHEVFDHSKEGYEEKIIAVSSGGPQLIVEMVANINLNKDLAMLARHGRVVVVGNRGSLDFNPRDLMNKDAAVLGLMVTSMPKEEYIANMYRLSAALENGLKVVVNKELPLEKASEAHRLVQEGKQVGKIVLTVEDVTKTP